MHLSAAVAGKIIMKYGKRTLAALLLCATIVAIFLCVQKEQLPNDVHYGTFNAVSGV